MQYHEHALQQARQEGLRLGATIARNLTYGGSDDDKLTGAYCKLVVESIAQQLEMEAKEAS